MGKRSFFRRRSAQRGRYSEHQAMERLQAQLTLGAWCIGGVAGLLAHVGGSDLNPLFSALLGLLLVVLAGICGGGLGFILNYALQRLRKSGEPPDQNSDFVGAVALGSATGAFLGLVAALSLGAWEQAPLIVAGCAGALSLAFTLAGRLAATMLRMLVLDSRHMRHDAEQEDTQQDSRRARRDAGQRPDAAGKGQDKRD